VRTLGQPIVVDNRFGAGGSIATGAAAKSAPAPPVIRKAGIKAE
jgi:tripartite-type tricarboxylate transporter receptor subunit TctC